MVRLWWLWWPQSARPPPQRWRQATEHSEAPPRGYATTARHHMPATAAATAGKVAVVVVVPAVVRRRGGGEGGKGGCEGGAVGGALSFRTLFTSGGNGVDVVVSMESIRAISERFAKMMYGFFWGKQVAYPVVANYVRNTWGKCRLVKSMLNSSTMIFSFQFSSIDGLDAVLENEDVGNALVWFKLHGVIVTAFSEDGLSALATKLGTPLMLDSYTSDMCIQSYACCKVFGHVQNECPNNINSDVVKNMKKPGQAPRGVLVGPKVGLKPVKQVYRHVSKKNNVNTSGNKKDVDLTIEVTLVDDEGKPLAKVDFSGDHDSEDKVASVDNKMTNFLALKKVGYGTNSLLEQWKETYVNDGYDFDPYDDGMYEGHDIPNKIQAICDNLDIKVSGRKKK
ncbi:hypothetical protein Tco_1026695 [Tanacetum coccineum]